ncbi:MAG TPA: hypothetical protein P5307_10180, partial [Pirellulaceae bacterium]|nr:hypothetical protein [Pirellulaceae bacterium]
TTGPFQFNATLWQGENQEFLETPEGVSSAAADISPNGEYVGGAVAFEDLTLFESVDQAAVWFNGELTRLEDADGNIFQGVVRGVSDNGYAVGHSADGRGFIWHESFGGVRLFDEWLLTEFGITVPTPVTVVWDVYFDGSHLNFAVSGLNALIRTTLPSSNGPAPEGEAPVSARDAFFEKFDPQDLEVDVLSIGQTITVAKLLWDRLPACQFSHDRLEAYPTYCLGGAKPNCSYGGDVGLLRPIAQSRNQLLPRY